MAAARAALVLDADGGRRREILFVCLGNICRSPYAEVRLRQLLDESGQGMRFGVRSSGFILPDRPSPPSAVHAALEMGLDLARHRSAIVSPESLDRADLVLVMTSTQRRDLRRLFGRRDAVHLGDLDPGPVPRRDITDPYGGSWEGFMDVYARLDRAVGSLHALLTRGVEAPEPPSDSGQSRR